MPNLLGKLTKNSIITVESDKRPGVIQKYLVEDVLPNRQVKLVYRDEVQVVPYSLAQLLEYMRDNGLNQRELAEILGKSRASVSRYLSGDREVPVWVYKRLGIAPVSTIMQVDARNEALLQQAVSIREQLDKLITLLQEVVTT
jgi:predicted transcriptional regulator